MTDNVVSLAPRKPKTTDPKALTIKISVSSGNQGRVTNQTMRWIELCSKLAATAWDSVTMEEYLAKPIAWQDKRKNQGYFVGGQFAGGARKLTAISERSLLTFDIDNCTPAQLADLEMGFTWLGDYEYMLYSTRKHTKARPRVRVVVPVAQEVKVAQYAPLARIIAQKIDVTMTAVDPVSFRAAQIMYWPSTCKDAEFVHVRNKGKLLDGPTVLRDWGDWTDYSKLPRSPREKDLREVADKATDPLTKRGIVGAFCRTYDIFGAIEHFLPDVYVPGDLAPEGAERFSYVGGSTTNGAVVYEGGKFLYSYHGTDPVADQLVNAFDLVRIHLYGGKDKPGEDDIEGGGEPTKPQDKPSYRAFSEALASDLAVVGQLRDDQYDVDAITADFDAEAVEMDDEDVANSIKVTFAEELVAKDFSPDAEAGAIPPPDPGWKDRLEVTDKGIIKNSLHNVALILDNDPRFRGALGYNDFLQEPVLVRRIKSKQHGYDTGPVLNRENGDYLTGTVEVVIRCILESPRGQGKTGYSLKVADRDMKDAITQVTSAHTFHPVKRYLESCQWDGTSRVAGVFVEYFHAPNTPYNRAVGHNWMVAAVARIFEPGCKFDFVPIIEGDQGIGKSTGLAVLAGRSRFGELRANFDDVAKLVENMQGNWLMEIPELAQFRRAEVETMKTFFSATMDRVRLAWGRGAKNYYRQTVFAGTTNTKEYLKDPTGARRYWPVILAPGKMVDVAGLRRDRDLLWAEAYQLYSFMRRQTNADDLPLFMDASVSKAAEAIQASRMETDPEAILLGQVQAWLDTPVSAEQAPCGYRSDVVDAMEEPSDGPLVMRQRVCVKDVIHYVLCISDRENEPKTAYLVGRVLARVAGWSKNRKVVRVNKRLGVQKVYDRDPP